MEYSDKVRQWIGCFFSGLKSIFFKIIGKRSAFCHIEEIDVSKKIIIIRCRGINAPIKASFYEIINDILILSNLSPKHASWIGYYYGKYYSELMSSKKEGAFSPDFDFFMNDPARRFCITMLDRRGNLICFYKKKISPKSFLVSRKNHLSLVKGKISNGNV